MVTTLERKVTFTNDVEQTEKVCGVCYVTRTTMLETASIIVVRREENWANNVSHIQGIMTDKAQQFLHVGRKRRCDRCWWREARREKRVASRRKNRYGEARFLYLSGELGDDFSRHLLPLCYVYLYESLILSLQCARRTY